ncbi:MAG: hypothetical protein WKF78_00365 [Candidatus Limnocylindrales bacterium]
MERTVALPGHARHLQLGAPGGPVLVPAEDSDMFLTVSLPGGQVERTDVGDYPHDAAQTASGRILVADERGGTLSVVQAGDVVATFDDVTQPGGVTAVGDRRRGRRCRRLHPQHVRRRRGGRRWTCCRPGRDRPTWSPMPAAVWWSPTPAGTRCCSSTSTRCARRPPSPWPVRRTASPTTPPPTSPWVTLTARNEVVGISLAGAEPVEVARFPTVRQPNTVAVDPATGRLWIASRTTGELQTIDR